MTKAEYERIRIEIHKKYKDEIQELKLEIIRLKEMIREESKKNNELKRELQIAEHKLNGLPNCNSMFELFSRYGDVFNNL